MSRVVGVDPGTSSLDLLLLVDGLAAAQHRFAPTALQGDADCLNSLLEAWAPIDLIAGPSGYGLPLIYRENIDLATIDLMALTRPHDRGKSVGVLGFRSWVQAFLETPWPLVFLPGGIHLPTIPEHRKLNKIDMGTPDKVAVAGLAIHSDQDRHSSFAVIEVGSAFTALLVIQDRRLVDASAGTCGPIGLKSSGVWDGEAAYWLGPLTKADLFRGGWTDMGTHADEAFGESLRKHVAALRAVTPFDFAYISGASLDRPHVRMMVENALKSLVDIAPLPSIDGAWVKHASQGAALLADGLAGGAHLRLVEDLALRHASGTILDYLRHRDSQGPIT
jgi:predicted butyrate kinase (DUF1464 family)